MIERFLLNLNDGYNIEIFGISHICLILLTIIAIIIIVKNKYTISSFSNVTKRTIRLFLAAILLINLFIRRGSFIYYGVYSWQVHLDINFCNFTSLLFLIYSLSGNKKIYSLCFYMAFIGPLMAILFPSVNISPLNYSFYSYLIIHHLIFVVNFIFLFTENLSYSKEDFYHVSGFLIIYFLIIKLFNLLFQTTYNELGDLINIKLTTNFFIDYICSNFLTTNLVFYLFVILLLLLGRKILRKLAIKK